MLFTTFTLFAAVVGGAYAAPASGRTVIQAPSGSGQIIVSQTQLRVTGCLNSEGLWNVVGDCATFSGDDDGGISGPEGYLVFTEDSGITTSPTSDTTWLGYYLNGNVSFGYFTRDKVHAEPDVGPLHTDAPYFVQTSATYVSADKTTVENASGQILRKYIGRHIHPSAPFSRKR